MCSLKTLLTGRLSVNSKVDRMEKAPAHTAKAWLGVAFGGLRETPVFLCSSTQRRKPAASLDCLAFLCKTSRYSFNNSSTRRDPNKEARASRNFRARWFLRAVVRQAEKTVCSNHVLAEDLCREQGCLSSDSLQELVACLPAHPCGWIIHDITRACIAVIAYAEFLH